MGKDLTMVALDSNAMTYWIEAMSSTTGPPGEPCGAEKVALARIYCWLPEESGYHLTPTVQQEYEAIKVQKKLEDHVSWRMVHISPVMPLRCNRASMSCVPFTKVRMIDGSLQSAS